MAVIKLLVSVILQVGIGALFALIAATAVRFVLRWPRRPERHAGTEMSLPVDPDDDWIDRTDWDIWEAELRQDEQA